MWLILVALCWGVAEGVVKGQQVNNHGLNDQQLMNVANEQEGSDMASDQDLKNMAWDFKISDMANEQEGSDMASDKDFKNMAKNIMINDMANDQEGNHKIRDMASEQDFKNMGKDFKINDMANYQEIKKMASDQQFKDNNNEHNLVIRNPGMGDKVVICYYTNWSYYRSGIGKFQVKDIDLATCSHLIYAFANLHPTTFTIQAFDAGLDLPDNNGLNNYGKFTALKQQKPDLKTLLALGGSTDSRGSYKYSDLVASPSKRNNFITHAVNFLLKYNFDGLDLDWEYPGYNDGGRPADKVNFGLFVKELKAAFKPKNLLLTAAVGATETVAKSGYDIPTLAANLDFINLMTYDFHGYWEETADHHSPLYKRDFDTSNFYAAFSVNHWIAGGAPASKLVLGVPLYGQSFTLSTSRITPPAPASDPGTAGVITEQAGFLSYVEICSRLSQGWTEVKDPTGKMGPYAYSGQQWVGYDDVTMVKKKTEFVRDQGLAGAMVWAIDLDDFQETCGQGRYPLMNVLSSELLTSAGSTTTPSTATQGPTTDKPTTVKPTTDKATTDKPTTDKATTSPQPTCSQTFSCPGDGLFADPCDCHKYYNCHASRPFHYTCAPGTMFNPAVKNCDWEQNVNCKITNPTTSATTTTATATTTAATTTAATTITVTTMKPSCDFVVTCDKISNVVTVHIAGLPDATFTCPGDQAFDTVQLKCVARSAREPLFI